jgi:hypothetical protein
VFDAFVDLLEPAFRDRFRAIETERAFSIPRFMDACETSGWLRSRYPSLFTGI